LEAQRLLLFLFGSGSSGLWYGYSLPQSTVFKRKIQVHQEEDFAGLESARQYAAEAQKSTMRYRTFFERLEILGVATGRYLDVGAGPGTVAEIIAGKYPQVELTALELSPDMVTVGQLASLMPKQEKSNGSLLNQRREVWVCQS
jgi:hypothetical protein